MTVLIFFFNLKIDGIQIEINSLLGILTQFDHVMGRSRDFTFTETNVSERYLNPWQEIGVSSMTYPYLNPNL